MWQMDRHIGRRTYYIYNYYQWNSFKICLQLTYECNHIHSCFDIENFSIYLLHSHWWKCGNQATTCFHRSDMNEYFKETTAQIIHVCMYLQNGRKTDRLIDSWIRLYVRHLYLWLSQCSFLMVMDGWDGLVGDCCKSIQSFDSST